MKKAPFFILGSSSPRRFALLEQIGIVPDLTLSPDIDETPFKGELPHLYVARIAKEKVAKIAGAHPEAIILGGDSVPACGRRILQKATSEEEALKIITLFSGRRHRFLSAIAVYNPETQRIKTRVVKTIVHMKHLSQKEIDLYLASEDWKDVAGYRFEGVAGGFIKSVNGSISGIIGLPLFETKNMLETVGLYPKMGACKRTATYD